MDSVKHSSSSLEDLALELGGTLRYDSGKVFNSAGRAGVTRLPKRPAIEAPPQQPQQPDRTAEILSRIVTLLERPQPTPEPAAPPTVVVQPPPPAPKRAWEFEVVYANGRLSKIVATEVGRE